SCASGRVLCDVSRSTAALPPPPLHAALPISRGARPGWRSRCPRRQRRRPPRPPRPPAGERGGPGGRRRCRRPAARRRPGPAPTRSEEHTSELQSRENLVCRLLREKKKKKKQQ